MKFREYSFLQLLSVIIDNRGKTVPTVENGIPLIATNCIKNEALFPSYEKIRYVSQEIYETWFRGHPQPGDMIFTCKGSPGKVCWVPDPIDFCIAQDMVGIRANEDIVYPKYLFALLRSVETQNKILNMHVGTLIPHFKKGDFGNLYFDIPIDMEHQKKVGDFYFDLCLKIEANYQINQTLEQMAQAIFKSWFVDFEPVKAKITALEAGGSEDDALLAAMQAIAGNALFASDAADTDAQTQLARLQAEHPEQYATLRATAELFPSAMQDSELGKIPEGWGTGSFKDLCLTVESGGTPKRNTPEYWGGKIKWLASGEVRDVVVLDTKETITESGLKNSSAKLWPMYTTVVAMYGATAGQVCLIADQMTSNQACCGLIPKKNYKAFTFFSAKRSIQSLSDKASGSAQQNLNKGLVEGHQTILPAETILVVYEDLVFPLMLKWIENIRESVMLAEARDTLLPKLLAGELSINKEID